MSQVIKAAIKAALVVTPTLNKYSRGRDVGYLMQLSHKISMEAISHPELRGSGVQVFYGKGIWAPKSSDPKYWVARSMYIPGKTVSLVVSMLFEDGVRGYILKGYRFEFVRSLPLKVLFNKLKAPRTAFDVIDTSTETSNAVNSKDVTRELLVFIADKIKASKYYIGFGMSKYPWAKFKEAYELGLTDVTWMDNYLAEELQKAQVRMRSKVIPVSNISQLKIKKFLNFDEAGIKMRNSSKKFITVTVSRKFSQAIPPQVVASMMEASNDYGQDARNAGRYGQDYFDNLRKANGWPVSVYVSREMEITETGFTMDVLFFDYWFGG
ncbi:hypothetical protein [Yersinia ruckeri]|uniref:hypothetical protein n=1 Tax=Yersinia ruckeri TaxID=29486 RepID=UPI002237E454|nr:hypothetical protein [Yersinia ruckeri]MCW6598761.1 hypothetical protein [Yersinia ruckeri]